MTNNKRVFDVIYVLALIAMLFSVALPAEAAPLSYSSNTNIDILTPAITLVVQAGSMADGVTINDTDVAVTMSTGETFVITSAQALSSVTAGSGGTNAKVCASGTETDTITQTTGSETYTLTPTGSACTQTVSTPSARSGGGAAAVIPTIPPPAGLGGRPLGFTVTNHAGNIITLSLNADPATVKGYAISTQPDFSDSTGILPYTSDPTYQLPNTNVHTLYLKYYSNTGNWSPVISENVGGATVSASATNGTTAAATPTLSPAVTFSRTLKLGSKGNDVLALQKFLNTHGFIIAKSGAGSPGYETTVFGTLTKAALIKFQNANASSILAPLGLTRGTGIVGPATIKVMNESF